MHVANTYCWDFVLADSPARTRVMNMLQAVALNEDYAARKIWGGRLDGSN
jgi:hypothetical protein